MKLSQFIPLSSIYSHEEKYSADLADNIAALDVGSFEDAETESKVGTRRADIVAVGDDGTLVIENQFGNADWDHWGRLEAYARLKEADVAILVAESFEELMIVTCNLRNEDSYIDWYLIEAQVNEHHELSFHQVVRPAIDIKMGPAGEKYSEFWEPIRQDDGLFAGKPVSLRNDGWICKTIKGVNLNLHLNDHGCSVILWFQGDDRSERRDNFLSVISDAQYKYELGESAKFAKVIFPVLPKGRKDRENWPDVRDKLTTLGTDIYNKIKDSDV